MSEQNAIVPVQQAMGWAETMELGKTLAQSGFFADAKDAAQAVVKVLAGRELGFGPIASMTGIHIVNGKPALGANLIAAKIKGSGRYTFRITDLSNERCEIAVFEAGEELQPRSVFSIQDASKAGLTTGRNAHSWSHYPRNMLFARAISNAARWHCPELFSGAPPYTPEELGATVDGEGEVIDVTPTVTTPPAATTTPSGNGTHWIKDEDSRKRFWVWAKERGLSSDDVHAALGVEHVEEFAGTKGEAMTAINDYIDAKIAAETEPAEVSE